MQTSFDGASATASAESKNSSWDPQTQQLQIRVDTLQRSVAQLTKLLEDADKSTAQLKDQLSKKEKQLQHKNSIHELSVRKLMELQQRELRRSGSFSSGSGNSRRGRSSSSSGQRSPRGGQSGASIGVGGGGRVRVPIRGGSSARKSPTNALAESSGHRSIFTVSAGPSTVTAHAEAVGLMDEIAGVGEAKQHPKQLSSPGGNGTGVPEEVEKVIRVAKEKLVRGSITQQEFDSIVESHARHRRISIDNPTQLDFESWDGEF